jgi:calcineurin-like phosphoesterase family protein
MRLKLEHQNIWFTSDYHFSHANVIKYDKRPFTSVEEMDEALIDGWNAKVKDTDVVFYLGDLSFDRDFGRTQAIAKQLKGKIHFILGNHDDERVIRKLGVFETVSDYINLSVKDLDNPRKYQDIMMFHYPILSWDKRHHGAWHLHGHEHQALATKPIYDWFYAFKVLDMGCNGWDYEPANYITIKKQMETKKNGEHH